MIADFKKIRTADDELRQVQDGIIRVVEDLRRREIIDGRRIKDVYVDSSAATTLDHGLGRKLNGWIITKKNADANLWQTNTTIDGHLILNTDSDVTVDLWVF